MVAVLLHTSQIQIKTDFTADRELLTQIINDLPIGEMSELAGLADTGDDNNEDTGAAFIADETEFTFSTPIRNWRRSREPRACSPRCRKKGAHLFRRRSQQNRRR
jgi:hypothetical protein